MNYLCIDLNKGSIGDRREGDGVEVHQIRYEELEEATRGWERGHLLGRGGFGAVYHAMWKNTRVAVKRLIYQVAPLCFWDI